MAFARNSAPMPQKGTLAYYEKQSAGARSSLFLVIALTIVNVILTVFAESDTMFLFSAVIPWTFAMIAAEVAEAMIIPLAIAVIYTVVSLICALFWKKGLAASIVATILYFADCLFVAVAMLGAGTEGLMDFLPMALFHVLIMIYLIVGIINEAKARKLRKEAEAPFTAEQENAHNGPEL